ncbi:pentapeptide repeat-containing protein [Streptomyces chilikensis]|uniref:Pentapeptide repeat-containing protein n=1 Tax=Streptomyces chilikensis TaxID=1194079 RepID=A0ABV3ERT0_9ACTN
MTVSNAASEYLSPPTWPHCGYGADPIGDSVGCRGRVVAPYDQCLRHLSAEDRTAYLASLTPGSDLDHSGTTFDTPLLDALLEPLRDRGSGSRHIANACFEDATFNGPATFNGTTFSSDADFTGAKFTGIAGLGDATFERDVWFDRARFDGEVWFSDTKFGGEASFEGMTCSEDARFDGATFVLDAKFNGARFSGEAAFGEVTFGEKAEFERVRFTKVKFTAATFRGHASFGQAAFSNTAWFPEVTFDGEADFGGVTFGGEARFHRATFGGEAEFGEARFYQDALFAGVQVEKANSLGPLLCAGHLDLSRAVFGGPVTVEATAQVVMCQRTQWQATATLRLEYARVDLTDAIFEYPLHVAARPTEFRRMSTLVVERQLMEGLDHGVQMLSISGTDAAHLMLSDVDLAGCQFAGTYHLDQLRLDGDCRFAWTPTWSSGMGLRRWSRRQTLVEEHYWRASQGLHGWIAHEDPEPEMIGPAGLARLYRQLRKSLEDSKDEPGAADFYYGEMEMRRHDRARSRGERGLLAAYWALSGYGLRASRALGWLLAGMGTTVLAMMLWGLPKGDPDSATTGTLTGRKIELTTSKDDPVNPDGALSTRLTSERFEKSLRVVVNSVVFRSSGQDLTTAGTYIEMASRVSEPVLLGLAVLAIRSRVKR